MQTCTINKPKKKEYYQYQKEAYVKSLDSLPVIFKQHNISPTARLIYLSSLAHHLYPNSAIAHADYKKIMDDTGLASNKTISTHLKELKDKKFIKEIERSNYLLNYGVFKGYKEKAKENIPKPIFEYKPKETIPYQQPEKIMIVDNNKTTILKSANITSLNQSKSVNNTLSSNSPKVYIYKQTNKKQLLPEKPDLKREIEDEAFFKNLIFKKNLFSNISPRQYGSWIRQYGPEKVQTTITKLEFCTKEIKSTAAGLVFKALQDGEQWEWENKQLERAKEREKEIATAKKIEYEIMRREDLREENGNKKNDSFYKEGLKDKSLVRNQTFILQREEPKLDINHDMFKARLYWRIVNAQKKKNEKMELE